LNAEQHIMDFMQISLRRTGMRKLGYLGIIGLLGLLGLSDPPLFSLFALFSLFGLFSAERATNGGGSPSSSRKEPSNGNNFKGAEAAGG
jgi:hypothetical protein